MESNGLQIINRIDYVLSAKHMNRNELCRDLGMRTGTLSNWKTRGTIPSVDDAIKIAKYLKVSIEWLVYGEGEEPFNDDYETSNFSEKFSRLSDTEKVAVQTLIDGFLRK